MARYGTQFRLVAQGLVDYLAGIDPSALGLVAALQILVRSRGGRRRAQGWRASTPRRCAATTIQCGKN